VAKQAVKYGAGKYGPESTGLVTIGEAVKDTW
jgi:hypothetical protein